jgi:hypothetical protein
MKFSRKRLQDKYSRLYRAFPYSPAGVCFYCGMPSDSIDHVPAYHWLDDLGADYFASNGIDLFRVHACRECNSMLGTDGIFCPLERRKSIQDELRKKYRRALKSVRWSLDELEELGDGLRKYVKNSDDFRMLMRKRVSYGRL